MLMRAAAAAAAVGVFAALLVSCATVPPSALPPVRDGTLPRAASAGGEPAPSRSDGPVSAPERVPASSAVLRPRPAAPLPAALQEATPEPEAAIPSPREEETREEGMPEIGTPEIGMPETGAPQAGNSAVVALLESAREAEAARQYGRAAAALERALKVDARDPRLWHRLAAVRFRQGRHAEAEALALRSLSLRRAGRNLDTRNWRIIATARRAQGDEEGAREALRRANSP